jgi:hypothetical protein
MAVSVLQRVLSRWRPAPIATVAGLRTFLEERALLIAQKCAIDYCRGKTGLASYALFSEETFLKALDVCRWEGFAAVLGDLLILAEAHLRAEAGAQRRAQLRDALVGMHSEILTSAAAPAHRAQGWHDVIAPFAGRLEAASAAAPRPAVEVADHSARRLFETMPIHSSYRELDEEVVFGAVRFRLIAVNGEMEQRIAPAPLVSELLG